MIVWNKTKCGLTWWQYGGGNQYWIYIRPGSASDTEILQGDDLQGEDLRDENLQDENLQDESLPLKTLDMSVIYYKHKYIERRKSDNI